MNISRIFVFFFIQKEMRFKVVFRPTCLNRVVNTWWLSRTNQIPVTSWIRFFWRVCSSNVYLFYKRKTAGQSDEFQLRSKYALKYEYSF